MTPGFLTPSETKWHVLEGSPPVWPTDPLQVIQTDPVAGAGRTGAIHCVPAAVATDRAPGLAGDSSD
jgi:hypothetical protein